MDALHDESKITLLKIARSVEMPEYVKKGYLLDKEADADRIAGIDSNLFADPMRRQYPLTDRANTWLSAMYFAKTAADRDGYSPIVYDAVSRRILKCAKAYGIGDDVAKAVLRLSGKDEESMKKKAAAMGPAPEDDKSNYCDPGCMGFPVFDADDCRTAVDYFQKNAFSYGWEKRREIATNLMRKCAEHGVEPAQLVRQSAGVGAPRIDTLMENLLFRSRDLMKRGCADGAVKMARMCEAMGSSPAAEIIGKLDEIREALGVLDEAHGLDGEYGKTLAAPEQVLFDMSPGELEGLSEDAVPLGGETLSAKALSSLPRALFESVLPHSSVEGMTEGGRLSPKKMSVTIVSLGGSDPRRLLSAIKRYAAGEDDYEMDGDSIEKAHGSLMSKVNGGGEGKGKDKGKKFEED